MVLNFAKCSDSDFTQINNELPTIEAFKLLFAKGRFWILRHVFAKVLRAHLGKVQILAQYYFMAANNRGYKQYFRGYVSSC